MAIILCFDAACVIVKQSIANSMLYACAYNICGVNMLFLT